MEINKGWQTVKGDHRKRQFLVGRNEQTSDVQTVPTIVSMRVKRLNPTTTPDELKKVLA